ncbi:Phosphatidylinositol (PI) 3-kinase [Entomophthora muscae]|uniref:Phosphatidylinositol (PI) 3-kinase n=1 Tax=Entomophthora muscae TaxID=34485 RepID=A0ACC2UAZ6_9FUNG|nr:Phosphatidylinositol (PI) 3-kinase [Entomophthora muscae]
MDSGGSRFKDFTFFFSSDVDLPLEVKICNLEGSRNPNSYSELVKDPDLRLKGVNQLGRKSDLYVECYVASDHCDSLTLSHRTRYKTFTHSWSVMPLANTSFLLNFVSLRAFEAKKFYLLSLCFPYNNIAF